MWEAACGHFAQFFNFPASAPQFCLSLFHSLGRHWRPHCAPVLRGGRASSCTAAAPFLGHTDKQDTSWRVGLCCACTDLPHCSWEGSSSQIHEKPEPFLVTLWCGYYNILFYGLKRKSSYCVCFSFDVLSWRHPFCTLLLWPHLTSMFFFCGWPLLHTFRINAVLLALGFWVVVFFFFLWHISILSFTSHSLPRCTSLLPLRGTFSPESLYLKNKVALFCNPLPLHMPLKSTCALQTYLHL